MQAASNTRRKGRNVLWRLAVAAIMVMAGSIAMLIVSPSFFTPTHAASAPNNWTTYGFGPERTGYNPVEKAINPTSASSLKQLWSVSTGSIMSVQPIVANGLIYWGTWDGIMHATKPNGTQAWTANLGQTPTPPACSGRTHGIMGAATFANVTIGGKKTPVIFDAGGKDIFYALNANTGAILWQNQISTPPTETWASSLFYQGSIYISTASWGDCPLTQAQIFRLNAATGTTQNTYNVVPNGCTGAGVWGSVSIDSTNSTLYFVTGNGGSCSQKETNAVAIVQLSATDLSFKASWQITNPGPDSDFGSTPTIFPATINGTTHRLAGVANKNGIYYAFDTASISNGPVWKDTIAIGGQGPEGGQGSISPSAWDGTTLYVAGGNTTINSQNCQGSVRAVNPATGAFIWQTCLTDGPVLGAVSAVSGVIVVGEGNAFVLISATDGHIFLKKFDPSSSPYYGGAGIAKGVAYMGNSDGTLFAFGTNTSVTPTPSPSPGTTIGQDTFQRASQSLWGTASDGQAWGADANSQSVFSIASNAGQIANGNNIYNATLGPSAGNADVLFSGSISSFSGANLGAVLRWTDANDLYKGYIDGTNLVIQKRVGGTSTTIATTPFAATAGTSYSLRFRAVGTTLTAKVWPTSATEPSNWMLTVTDSALASGSCGLRVQIQTGTIITITSFVATAE